MPGMAKQGSFKPLGGQKNEWSEENEYPGILEDLNRR
jgi:hypothetical protein